MKHKKSEKRLHIYLTRFHEKNMPIKNKKLKRPKCILKISCLFKEKESIKMLSAILIGSDNGIIAKDLNGFITSGNRSAEEIFEYKSNKMIGKSIDFLFPLSQFKNWRLNDDVNLKVKDKSHFIDEHICKKEKKRITVLNHAFPILNSNAEVIGTFFTTKTIAKQKKNQLALDEANNELSFQSDEIESNSEDLVISNKEKVNHVDELVITNEELLFQNEQKEKRAAELVIANEEKDKLEALNKKKLHLSLMETIGIARELVEMRDPYTAGHEQHVGDLAKAIGQEMGLDDHFQEGLMIAGYLHDIGKIIIPEAILCKPGKISVEEYNLIKNHVQAGYDLLKNVNFPWDISRSVLEHHERLDGSGYPNSLKGSQISLEGRIMAVADIVEAMSAFRPYRPSLGVENALEELERGRSRIFDEKVVDACLRLFRKKAYKIATTLN